MQMKAIGHQFSKQDREHMGFWLSQLEAAGVPVQGVSRDLKVQAVTYAMLRGVTDLRTLGKATGWGATTPEARKLIVDALTEIKVFIDANQSAVPDLILRKADLVRASYLRNSRKLEMLLRQPGIQMVLRTTEWSFSESAYLQVLQRGIKASNINIISIELAQTVDELTHVAKSIADRLVFRTYRGVCKEV